MANKRNGWGSARPGKVQTELTQYCEYTESNVKSSSIKDGMYKEYQGKKGTKKS